MVLFVRLRFLLSAFISVVVTRIVIANLHSFFNRSDQKTDDYAEPEPESAEEKCFSFCHNEFLL